MPIDPAVMGGAMPMGPAPAPMPPGPEGPVDLETIRRVVAEAVSEALADGKDGKKSEGSSAQSSDLTARLDQIEQKIDALADVIASLLGPMSPPQSLPSVSSDQAAMMGTQTPQLASPPGSPAGSNALLRVVQDLANQGRQ